MSEPSCSTISSDISSSYQSDVDVAFKSFLAKSSLSSSPQSPDSKHSGSRNRKINGECPQHLLQEEWEDLLNTDFKANPGRVSTYPKSAAEYVEKNYKTTMIGLSAILDATTAVMYICGSLRNTLDIYDHRRKPNSLLFDVCIFRPNHPNLVISVQSTSEDNSDMTYYNTKVSRELNGNIRSHTVSNFNLLHGVLDVNSDPKEVLDCVSDWELVGRRDYQSHSLNMDDDTCSDVVKRFASLISKSNISTPVIDSSTPEDSMTDDMSLEGTETSTANEETFRYVETRAYHKIRAKLKQYGFITITGLPGDGKTHAALVLSHDYKKLGYELLFMDNLVICDLESRLSDGEKYFLIFDDIFKNGQVTESLKSALTLLTLHTTESEHSSQESEQNIVAVCTSQCYNLYEGLMSLLDRSLFMRESIFDLSKMKYDTSETRAIFLKQCKLHKRKHPQDTDVAFVSEIGQTMPGFPLICKLYFEVADRGSIKDFFKNPIVYYERVFDGIIKDKSSAFAATAFVFLSSKSIDICLLEEGCYDEELILKLRNLVPNFTTTDIYNAVKHLRKVFFTSGEIIEFANSVIYNAFASSLFNFNPLLVLRHCKLEFLCERITSDITLETFTDVQNMIHLSQAHQDVVAPRLTHAIEGGQFKLPLSHHPLQHTSVVDQVFGGMRLHNLKSLFDDGKHLLYWAVQSDSSALVKKVLSLMTKLPSVSKEQCMESCLISGDCNQGFVVVPPGKKISIQDGCLLLAVELKCLKVTPFLLNNDANVSCVNRKKQNVFHLACSNNQKDMVKLLLDHCSLETISAVINNRDRTNLSPVVIAAMNGNWKIFQLLQSVKADIHVGKDSDTLLQLGCDGGSIEIVECLLRIFDINSKGNQLATPLMRAAAKGHVHLVDFLLSHRADPNMRDLKGDMTIHYACRSNSIPTVNRLTTVCDINVRGGDDLTPVMIAALVGDKDLFHFLVANRADLSMSGSSNNTVVHYATKGGNCDIVRCVVSPSNINSRGEHGRTPLMMAAAHGHFDVLDFLLSQRADIAVTDQDNSSILHIALDASIADFIATIKRVVDINHRDVHGRTPLMIAAMKGDATAFQLFLDNDADDSLSDFKRNTIHHLACMGGNLDIVNQLSTASISHIPFANGKTPIMVAAEEGYIKVVKRLMTGEVLRQKDLSHNNLLHIACHSGKRNLVEYLLPKFEINSRGEDKRTPLMIAVVYGHTELFKFLLKQGADFTLKDRQGNTCLDLACRADRVDIIEYMFSQYFLISSRFGKRVFEVAAKHGREQIFFKLLEMRSDEMRQQIRQNPKIFLKACEGGNIRIVQYIMKHENPAINTSDSLGRTAVMITADRGYPDLFHVLIEEGCNLALTDKNGNTILHSACRGGSEDIVRYVLSTDEGRPMVNRRRTSDGFTPLMVCIADSQYKENIFKVLTELDCDLTLVDKDKNTVLHWATKKMRRECVRYLLSKGMDADAQNKRRETPRSLTAYTSTGIRDLFGDIQE